VSQTRDVTESDEEYLERHMAGLSRRTLIGGAIAGGTLAAFGINPLPAFASGPTTAAAAVAEARKYLGWKFLDIRGETTGEWATYPIADWCAWFASWCIRGLGAGLIRDAGDMKSVGGEYTSPEVGDIVVFGQHHTGIVSKIVDGTPWLIDGNGVSTGDDITTRKVAERPVWAEAHTYTRPDYATTEPGGNTMAAFIQATDLTSTWYVVEEFEVRTITTQSVASQFNKVYGESIKVTSTVANAMIAHAQANRTSLINDIAAAVNAP
jgi:hypothetical protein